MLFNSYSFLLFFPLVLIAVGLVPARWKNPALLLASYYFYSCFSKRYCLLLLGCTLVVYFAARLLRNRKWAFWGGLTILLGVLALFKYTDFALYTLEKLLGKLGSDRSLPRLNLILPMGISFFTFQAAGYLMDVYKGKYPPEENFVRFALFVSFFPQLVSGPIGRGDQLLPQYAAPEKPRFQDLRAGLLTLTWGYFLKLVIADRAAILVDTVYGNIEGFPGICLVFATMLYALQILCDFSGCSSMAIGAARMLGIQPELRDESSTDANIPISMSIPAIAVGRGGREGGVHTTHEWFEPVEAWLGPQRDLLLLLLLAGLEGCVEPVIEKRTCHNRKRSAGRVYGSQPGERRPIADDSGQGPRSQPPGGPAGAFRNFTPSTAVSPSAPALPWVPTGCGGQTVSRVLRRGQY